MPSNLVSNYCVLFEFVYRKRVWLVLGDVVDFIVSCRNTIVLFEFVYRKRVWLVLGDVVDFIVSCRNTIIFGILFSYQQSLGSVTVSGSAPCQVLC